MNRKRILSAVLFAAGFGLLALSESVQASDKPNIILMLMDNIGFGALSSYNGGVLDTPTPRLDRLAAEGVRLTNFNVENQCTPTRAALLTGRLPIRSGIGKAMAAGAPGGLHPWEVTLAEMLSDAASAPSSSSERHGKAARSSPTSFSCRAVLAPARSSKRVITVVRS
jgi:arylsulfatase